jgi:hypothetical protein
MSVVPRGHVVETLLCHDDKDNQKILIKILNSLRNKKSGGPQTAALA